MRASRKVLIVPLVLAGLFLIGPIVFGISLLFRIPCLGFSLLCTHMPLVATFVILLSVVVLWKIGSASVTKFISGLRTASLPGWAGRVYVLGVGTFLAADAVAFVFGSISVYWPGLSAGLLFASLGLSLAAAVVAGMSMRLRKRALTMAGAALVLPFLLWAGNAFGILLSTSANWWISSPPSMAQYPLRSPKGIAVDSEGRMCCAMGFYSRLQVYTKDGVFLRGWFVPMGQASCLIRFTETNEINLLTRRRSQVYDLEGHLLASERTTLAAFEKEFGDLRDQLETRDAMGNTYTFRNPLLICPVVVKITPDGEESVLIRSSFSQTVLHPVWMVATFLVLMAVIAGQEIRKRRK